MSTFYVNPTGSDSNDGSAYDSAFLTIKYAVEQSTHGSLSYGGGHTVLVYPAAAANHSYAENNTINLQGGGKLQKGMTIKAITGSYDVAIDFTNNDDSVGIRTYLFTKIEGFTFTKAPEQTNSPTSAASVITGDGSTTGPINVVNCTFDNCSGSSANSEVIDVPGPYTPSAGNSVIERCVFKNCFRPLVANGTTSPSFRACLAHDCTSSKSTFDAYKGTIENCTAVRCRVVDDANQHIFSVSVAGSSVAQIRNCIASYCYTKGYLMNSSADPPISASLAYDNTFDTSRLFGTATAECVTTAPKFVSLGNNDFHLKCRSPASGSGTGWIEIGVGVGEDENETGPFGHESNKIIASQSHDLDGIAFDRGHDTHVTGGIPSAGGSPGQGSALSTGPYRNMGCYDTGGPVVLDKANRGVTQRLRWVDAALAYVPGTTLTLRCFTPLGYSHKIIGIEGDNVGKFVGVEGPNVLKAIGVET